MSRLQAVLSRVMGDLTAEGFRFAVVGGLAVSTWVEPRFTRDIDLAVSVAGDRQAEHLVRSLEVHGYRVVFLVEHETSSRLAQVRLCPPGEDSGGVVVDLLFASSGIEPEIAATATELELFRGLCAPVASMPHLVALKVLARDDDRRPQDRADLMGLLSAMGESDIEEARGALRQITARGFDRGRRLLDLLDAALADRT